MDYEGGIAVVIIKIKNIAIKVKEILTSVKSYTRGNNGQVNATDEFKTRFTAQLAELKNTLKNDDKTVSELTSTIDDLVFNLLDYRYNIVDYCHLFRRQ